MWRVMLVCLLALLVSGQGVAGSAPIRIGISPAVLHDQHGAMIDLRRYLEARTGRAIELIPRGSYREIFDLMRQDKLDFAWVSAYPYLYLRRTLKVKLVVAPLFQGRPYFRACLIVPASDKTTLSLLDLGSKFFAYADPDSFTGHFLPRYELRLAGKDSRTFFAKTFFVHGQRNVVRAVAEGLADAAYVHDFAWQALAEQEPDLAAGVRVAARSQEYGAAPIVARANINAGDVRLLQRVLLEMAGDPEGAALLKGQRIDGFGISEPKAYDEVGRIMRAMGKP